MLENAAPHPIAHLGAGEEIRLFGEQVSSCGGRAEGLGAVAVAIDPLATKRSGGDCATFVTNPAGEDGGGVCLPAERRRCQSSLHRSMQSSLVKGCQQHLMVVVVGCEGPLHRCLCPYVHREEQTPNRISKTRADPSRSLEIKIALRERIRISVSPGLRAVVTGRIRAGVKHPRFHSVRGTDCRLIWLLLSRLRTDCLPHRALETRAVRYRLAPGVGKHAQIKASATRDQSRLLSIVRG